MSTSAVVVASGARWLVTVKTPTVTAAAVTALVGPSNYALAVQQGYAGTLAQWLESLKGENSYQLAVADGFTGTESEWLASLVGPANTLTEGTATTGAPGSDMSFEITGDAPHQTLNLTIPRGDTGAPGANATVAVVSTATGAPGTDAAVVNEGTPSTAQLAFTIPRGDKGDKGDPGASGGIQSIVPGAGITVDASDPANPVVATASGGASLTWRGDWTPEADYAVNDVVLRDGLLYRCATPVTADGLAYRGTVTGDAGNNPATLVPPAGSQVGDTIVLVVAKYAYQSPVSFSYPAFTALLEAVGGTNLQYGVYTKELVEADLAGITFDAAYMSCALALSVYSAATVIAFGNTAGLTTPAVTAASGSAVVGLVVSAPRYDSTLSFACADLGDVVTINSVRQNSWRSAIGVGHEPFTGSPTTPRTFTSTGATTGESPYAATVVLAATTAFPSGYFELIGMTEPPPIASTDLTDFAATAPTDGQVPTWDADASQYVPATPSGGGSSGSREALFKLSGTLSAGTGTTRLYNDTGAAWTISSVRATVETAPSGGTVVVDVNIDGTTIFTTQANRPTIADGGATSGKVTSMDVTTVPDGSYLTVDVDAFTSPAANLTVTLVIS